MADFYYRFGETSIGPLTGVELREAAFAGQVVPDMFVAASENGPWVPATRVKGLFDEHGKTLPHPPEAQRVVERSRTVGDFWPPPKPTQQTPAMTPPQSSPTQPPKLEPRAEIVEAEVVPPPTRNPVHLEIVGELSQMQQVWQQIKTTITPEVRKGLIIGSSAVVVLVVFVLCAGIGGQPAARTPLGSATSGTSISEPNSGLSPEPKIENPKVRVFKEKVAQFLDEAHASAKLLTISPSLEEATAKAQLLKDLYTHLPEVPPEIDSTGEVADLLERLENQPNIGINMIKLADEAKRLRSVDSLKKVQEACRKLAVVMNELSDEIEARVGLPTAVGKTPVQSAPQSRPSPAIQPERIDPGDITDERFAAVSAVFEQKGVRCERDPSFPNTVRIYLPATVVPTKEYAVVLATTARSRLGDNAIVYVKAVDGSTLAKAAPWGVSSSL